MRNGQQSIIVRKRKVVYPIFLHRQQYVTLLLFQRDSAIADEIYIVTPPIKTSMMQEGILLRGLRNKALVYSSLVVLDFLNRGRKG